MAKEAEDARRTVTVESVMTKNPRFVTKTDSIQDAALIMREEDTGIVPVCDELDCVIGVVADRDLVTSPAVPTSAVGRAIEDISEDRGSARS